MIAQEKKKKRKRKTTRERKVEIGRDDVLMWRQTTRILLKRVRTMTGWKCQEI
jgi:hypothetical protein